MDFLEPETLDLFLIYVVPGFVTMKVHDLLRPPKERNFSSALIEIVSYSMLNLAALFWLFQILQRPGFKDGHPVGYAAGMLAAVAVVPAFWAVLGKRLRESTWFQRYSPHPSPSAWDYFIRRRKPGWVQFHLKSGETLGGLYSTDFFSSSFPSDPNIYVEEVGRIDGEGRFLAPIKQSGGALVRFDECTHLEFFELGG